MMPSNSRPFIIRDRGQLRSLASPVRQEIVDVLCQLGTVAVSELAATLDRPADALYYHLRALLKCGLVKHAGHRLYGKRREELFRSVSSDLRLQYTTGVGGNGREITTIVASMLRLGARDFARAFRHGEAVVSGAGRELWALRRTGWLTRPQIVAMNRSMTQLSDAVSKPLGKGRLYAITLLVTPVDRRCHPRGKSATAARQARRKR
jgi:DNA-binding transcriptional ArsR family regulator